MPRTTASLRSIVGGEYSGENYHSTIISTCKGFRVGRWSILNEHCNRYLVLENYPICFCECRCNCGTQLNSRCSSNRNISVGGHTPRAIYQENASSVWGLSPYVLLENVIRESVLVQRTGIEKPFTGCNLAVLLLLQQQSNMSLELLVIMISQFQKPVIHFVREYRIFGECCAVFMSHKYYSAHRLNVGSIESWNDTE